jgi:hypothetical protein
MLPSRRIGRACSTVSGNLRGNRNDDSAKSACEFGLAIYADPLFWRIAPLSAMTTAASWPIQGLWAAPWLAHVEELERGQVVAHLFAMATAVSVGALLLGVVADRLRRRGISPQNLLAAVGANAILAQLVIIMRMPVLSYGAWIIISVAGVATVLSFASIAELFPKEASGRANAALNLLHVGVAFLIQCLTWFVVALWPEQSGHHPAIAYQTACAVNLVLQVGALAWFLLHHQASKAPVFLAHAIHHRSMAWADCLSAAAGYVRAVEMWIARNAAARQQGAAWRAAAVASAVLALGLSGLYAQAIAAQRTDAVHVVQLRHTGPVVGRGYVVSAGTITVNSRSEWVDLQSGPATLAARGSGLCSP